MTSMIAVKYDGMKGMFALPMQTITSMTTLAEFVRKTGTLW